MLQRTSLHFVGLIRSLCHAGADHTFAVLHPYFKLRYIEEQWGGQEEYQANLVNSEPNARNWQKYARGVVKKAVSSAPSLHSLSN